MITTAPTVVRVRCGWLDGRPRAIWLAEEELPILEIEQIRDESAAYPVERGPRTIFDVRTPDARLRLTYQHRRRRWLLEALDSLAVAANELARAA
jgi:hypothetical protein